MRYKKLGQTDIDVSTICLGCWGFAGDAMWGAQAEADSIATIHAALDQGVNFFDTAEAYGEGRSEEVVGKALLDRRDKAILASKVSADNLAPEALRQSCENSLRRLQTDYLDLYQIHWPSQEHSLDEAMATLEQLKTEGKIRAIGISNFGVQDLDNFLTIGHAETNQLAYSLLWRAIEYEIKPKCVKNNMGILCYSSLMHGILTGKFATADDVPPERARTRHFSPKRPQIRHTEPGCEVETFAALDDIRAMSRETGHSMIDLATSWLLHQSGVTSVITGARRPDQIEQIAPAADIDLSEAMIKRLNQATDPVKEKLGPNADMWESESRIR